MIGLLFVISTAGQAAAVAPSWGPAWHFGSEALSRQSLARTATSTTEYLHSVTSTIDGWAYHYPDGAWYRRTASDGATWSKVKRLNPASHLVDGASVATAGRYVYATWVRQAESGTARMLYVRRNTNHGNLSAWFARIRLTSTTARIDAPSIAASGQHVYIAYTNARTGTIRLRSSHDKGLTWTARSLGTTTATAFVGLTGQPIVVATGRTVGVFWVADAGGSVRGRLSTDAGAHWGSAVTLGSGVVPTASASGDRIAVAASDGTSPGWFRVWSAGAWGPATLIPPRDVDPEPPLGYGRMTTVTLRGAAFVGVAYTVKYLNFGSWPLVWRESANGGDVWQPDETVSIPGEAANVDASVVWRADGLHVQWNEYIEDPLMRLRSRR